MDCDCLRLSGMFKSAPSTTLKWCWKIDLKLKVRLLILNYQAWMCVFFWFYLNWQVNNKLNAKIRLTRNIGHQLISYSCHHNIKTRRGKKAHILVIYR